jgi:hypothetical protein
VLREDTKNAAILMILSCPVKSTAIKERSDHSSPPSCVALVFKINVSKEI